MPCCFQHVISKRPHEYLSAEDLPASLDYRDTGLLTMDLNQHIPGTLRDTI